MWSKTFSISTNWQKPLSKLCEFYQFYGSLLLCAEHVFSGTLPNILLSLKQRDSFKLVEPVTSDW